MAFLSAFFSSLVLAFLHLCAKNKKNLFLNPRVENFFFIGVREEVEMGMIFSSSTALMYIEEVWATNNKKKEVP